MAGRTIHRLGDIIDAIDAIYSLLEEKTFEQMVSDRIAKAAFERFLEILSEASRHIPEALRREAPQIPWRRIGDIGNHLRHAYHRVDAEILWTLFDDGDLAKLREAAGHLQTIERQREAK
jgi:uncharacterized protein with HEPN domain